VNIQYLTLFLDKAMCYQQQKEQLRASWILVRIFQKNFGYEIAKMRHLITKYLAMLDTMKAFSNIANDFYQIH
jgi:hypothetical protein